MPADDYAFAGGGALKLKGAKISKKKKKRTKTDLEKNLSTGAEGSSSSSKALTKKDQDDAEEEQDAVQAPPPPKTESERRYEEAKRRKLQQLAEQSGARPELLKTHKERVEELNTYLSKLSEHHDMPKIGPG